MKKITFALFSLLFISQVMAQDLTLKLWPNGAPNKNEAPGKEEYTHDGITRVENITEAELFVYLPEKEKSTGAAVVICPGGGYWIEAIEHEGFDIAEYLKSIGVAGIVLKYRLPYGNHEIPVTDGLQAMRVVRSKAKEWNLDINKIGVAGSSAGGHLASTIGTHFDMGNPDADNELAKLSSRPDFMLLLYPVISFDEKVGHMGSRINLIGKTNDWNLAKKYSNELWVDKNTPPTFFILADDDKAVPPQNSIEFYMALKKYDIPAELHIFHKGSHGFGMKKDSNLPVIQWPELFKEWLQSMEITK
ncbi:alpha/beta hydrolase [Sunxiuqinia sp. A32]|uniref:alpha/beta hydrolase n=1 Tax=Sunxiuqinia sp. A32 TaxID=3461496 RepID=UPI004045FA4A